jgi:hypothetical protein
MRRILSGLGSIVCLCFCLLFTCSGGVPADTSFKVQIRWLQSPWKLPTTLQRQSTDHLVQWLQSKGIGVADKARQILWCDVYTFEGSDSGNVVLSVGVAQALPARVIELGKKAQILYSGMSAKERASLPNEGKWVRESLSEDFLFEYLQPIDHELVIVSKSHLFERLDEIAEQLYRRHFKR